MDVQFTVLWKRQILLQYLLTDSESMSRSHTFYSGRVLLYEVCSFASSKNYRTSKMKLPLYYGALSTIQVSDRCTRRFTPSLAHFSQTLLAIFTFNVCEQFIAAQKSRSSSRDQKVSKLPLKTCQSIPVNASINWWGLGIKISYRIFQISAPQDFCTRYAWCKLHF